MAARLAWTSLAAVLLAGCTSGGADVVLEADEARWLPRYDYDYEGEQFTRAAGRLTASVNTRADSGNIEATLSVGPDTYEVRWTSFAATAEYQSGGAARGLYVHGSTGNGTSELPRFFAYVACYGEATVRHNGEADFDPTTGRPEFRARLLVARGHVRDPETGIVYNDARTGPYDPAQPEAAFVNTTGAQAILQLRTATDALWYHFEYEDVWLEKY